MQNTGRVEGMRQARDKLGVKVKKRWMAFLDSHTRDAHADLDGQVAEVDEPFDSMLGPIMYPGDPEAEPANVYNCRCTLVYEYPEYPDKIDRVDEDGENVGDMSYKAWREMKAGKALTDEDGNGTMATDTKENGDNVKLLCKLDRNLYSCIAQDIATDNVVITNERIQHVQKRHPGDYEKYGEHIPKMIKEPDCIIQSKSYATAMVLKHIKTDDGLHLRLILRLHTSIDNPTYENSILSFHKTNAEEFERLVNKADNDGRLLYKRKDL